MGFDSFSKFIGKGKYQFFYIISSMTNCYDYDTRHGVKHYLIPGLRPLSWMRLHKELVSPVWKGVIWHFSFPTLTWPSKSYPHDFSFCLYNEHLLISLKTFLSLHSCLFMNMKPFISVLSEGISSQPVINSKIIDYWYEAVKIADFLK